MKTLKENSKYKLVDVRNTSFEGRYQLLEITENFKNGETIGVYFNRKDAIQAYNGLI